MLIHVLLAVESPEQRKRLQRALRQRDVTVSEIGETSRLHERLRGRDFDLLIVDRQRLGSLPDNLIADVRALPERPEIVVMTDRDGSGERASLLALGCLSVLNPNLEDRALEDVLRALVARRREESNNRLLADRPEERYSLNDFVSESPTMQLFLDLARRVVPSVTSVLILGETGVGKERLARAIHLEGPRASRPFLAVNCGAIPESLMESELFGHEEGAFTGATRARRGYFELAHGGTIFLDEIGEMPSHLQVKLLRVLDERKVRRVGGEKLIDVDVRVMAATRKDLEAEVQRDGFRSDLFYRLAVVTLTLPPLRDRREDIADLVRGYLEHFRRQTGRQITSVAADAMQVMTAYAWPGNVRELVNAMERAFLLCPTDEIRVEDLPVRIVASARGTRPVLASLTGVDDSRPLPDELLSKTLSAARKEIVAAFESRYLAGLLESTRGRIGETAGKAGINERSVYELMKRHGLRKEQFKPRRESRRPDELSADPKNP